MKIININTNGIKDAIMAAHGLSLENSWRKPIYCKNYRSFDAILNTMQSQDEITIELDFSGDWLCNAYAMNQLELFAIRAWNCQCANDPNEDPLDPCDHSYETKMQYDNICSLLYRMFTDDLNQYAIMENIELSWTVEIN